MGKIAKKKQSEGVPQIQCHVVKNPIDCFFGDFVHWERSLKSY